MDDLNINELIEVGDLPGTGTDIVTLEPIQLEEKTSNPTNRSIDLTEDYTNVRKMLYFQQQMLMEAAKVSLEHARGSDAPRVMEVFATLMGQMTTTNKELLRVHKDMKDITSEQPLTAHAKGANPQANITATNVFVGTPADLMTKVGSQYDIIESSVDDVELEETDNGDA